MCIKLNRNYYYHVRAINNNSIVRPLQPQTYNSNPWCIRMNRTARNKRERSFIYCTHQHCKAFLLNAQLVTDYNLLLVYV